MSAALFSSRLLKWWDANGRKDLPWQQPRSPYRVWVAEIMLQQTQVKTVIPYFEAFIEQFPDIRSLAAASQDDVLARWSGLGYYARARNLLKTAKICAQEHDSMLPDSPEALFKLPGIGESTANAIYSQSSNHPATVLDGNVKRVLSRYFAIEGWSGTSRIHKQLWDAASKLLPDHRGADYTQAIMDLGATVCARSKPQCDLCPVNDDCKAFQTDTVAHYPTPRPKIKIHNKTLHMLIIPDDKGRVLLERRPPAGIWGGLWTLPMEENAETLVHRLGVGQQDTNKLPNLNHQLTHMKMTICPIIGKTGSCAKGVECTSDQQWFSNNEWPQLGLPRPVRQLLETYL